MEAEAIWLTLRLAAITTVLLLTGALPLAWWIGRGTGMTRSLVQATVALPLVLPPTVIGFYLLIGLGPVTALGRGIAALLGHPLAFSFTGLVVGSLLYSLPFAVQPLVAGFQAIDPGYFESASGLGMTPGQQLWNVALPMARNSILTSAVLTFTHTVGEFGVVLMVGGNIPGVTRTLSISLYDRVEDGDYAAAAHLSLLLLAFSILALGTIYIRSGRQQKRAPDGR
jgi:molybdate transport system permease protein